MSTWRSIVGRCAVLAAISLVAGCVVGDQLATFTIQPDGSADYVVFRSNLRSTEKGEKAANELADYKARFDARTEDELTRIGKSGGTIVDASWIREQAPLANLVHARFGDAAALERFLTIQNDDGSFALKTEFKIDGARRRLTCRLELGKGDPELPPTTAYQLRQSLANAISETRVALAGGTITAVRGFTVAADKQSALLDVGMVHEIMRGGGQGELFLEWEVAP